MFSSLSIVQQTAGRDPLVFYFHNDSKTFCGSGGFATIFALEEVEFYVPDFPPPKVFRWDSNAVPFTPTPFEFRASATPFDPWADAHDPFKFQ